MSRHDEIRSRFLRLVGPQLHTADLTHLFLWLRERAFGSAAIREIGDFVAHADEREKGPVTNELRDFLLHSRLMHRLGPSIDLLNVPADFTSVLSRNFDRLPREVIIRETEMKPTEARRILNALLSKFELAPDGGATLVQRSVTRPEIEVLQCVLRYYNARAVFTADDVTRDFLIVAQKNKLIEGIGDQLKETLKPLLAMFALQAMHRTTIVLQDQWRATLNAGTYRGELAVFASTVFETQPPSPRQGVQVPIFTTGIPARDWCDDALEVGEYVAWNKPIELTSERKLTALALIEA